MIALTKQNREKQTTSKYLDSILCPSEFNFPVLLLVKIMAIIISAKCTLHSLAITIPAASHIYREDVVHYNSEGDDALPEI